MKSSDLKTKLTSSLKPRKIKHFANGSKIGSKTTGWLKVRALYSVTNYNIPISYVGW